MSALASTNCAACPHQADCRNKGSCLDEINAAQLAKRRSCPYPTLMTPAQVSDCMGALQKEQTVRRICGGGKYGRPIVSSLKFRRHCAAYPEWGAEALRLAKANELAANVLRTRINLAIARERSAVSRRTAEKCKNGHIRTMENTFYVEYGGCLVRRCKDCNKNARENRMPTLDRVRVSVASLHEGGTLSSQGSYTLSVMRNFIKANPKIGGRLVTLSERNASAHRSAAQRRARRRMAASSLMRNNGEDAYEAVRRATAHVLEDERDDVMSRMFVAIAEGRLKLPDVGSRLGEFVADQRRRPRVYGEARFSLDSPVGEDGEMTWLDTKTDADRLWG